jgi:hypothetical protein
MKRNPSRISNASSDSYDDLSSSFREILLSKPHFLVRRSVYLCTAILLVIIALTCLVRYPKVLSTHGSIISMKKGDSGLINQHVAYNKADPPDLYAKGYIPETYINQIKPGLDVLIKLDAYPFQEFGLLKGRLLSVSPKLCDSGYLTISILPQGVAALEQKRIQYQEGMGARVEIIFENKRLIQRFF